MNTLWAIAGLTFKEGLRQRIIYGVMIFAFALMSFSVLAAGLFMRDIGKIILDICLASVSLGGLLVPFFLTVNLLAGDLERRTIYTILSQPVSRTYYIIGKFLGLASLAFVIMLILTITSLLAVQVGILLFTSKYFLSYSITAVLISSLSSFAGVALLIACVIFWSSVTTSSFLATLLTISTYLIGQTMEELVRFMAVKTPGVEFSPFLNKTVFLVLYIFPNLAAFDLKQQAAHGIIPSMAHLFFLGLYGIGYSIVIITLATFFFSRRDLA